MKEPTLSKNEKKVLLLLNKHGGDALDTMPRSVVRRALRSLESQALVQVAWIEGGDYEAVRLTRDGKDYLIENPKLRNPINWKWVIGILISAATLIATIVLGCIACSKLG